MPSNRIITAAACGSLLAVGIAAAAPSALASVSTHPKPGNYAQMDAHNNYKMEFTLANHRVSGAEHYDNCVRVPILMPKVKVVGGKFHYSGTRQDAVGNKFKVHLTGKFVTRTKAKGTWQAQEVSGGSCTSTFSYKVHWVAPSN